MTRKKTVNCCRSNVNTIMEYKKTMNSLDNTKNIKNY